ncbi:MAG: hypothetical protein PUA90_04630 [bacterium]|nr:hypothetical protein [bacterium]
MINVLHLYYDLLNLYGENANTRCIVHNLELNNIKVKVDLKSINDKIDFNKYDIIYIGSGSEEDILIALEDLKLRKQEIKKYIEDNKYLFLTGNSMDMFGKYIDTINTKVDALNIFDYYVEYLNEDVFHNASRNRIVGEVRAKSKIISEEIIGFQNRCDLVINSKSPLFETNEKYSNDLKNNKEGFNYKNVYATHIIGPLFIRNPYLIDYFLYNICKLKKLKYKSLDKISIKAYEKHTSKLIDENDIKD